MCQTKFWSLDLDFFLCGSLLKKLHLWHFLAKSRMSTWYSSPQSVVWQRFSGFIKWVFSLYIRQIKTLNHQIHPVQSFYKPMSSCFGFWKEGLPMAKMLQTRRNHRNQKASCQSVVWQRFSGFIKCFWLFFCPDQPLKHQIHPVQSFYKPIWWFCCKFWVVMSLRACWIWEKPWESWRAL